MSRPIHSARAVQLNFPESPSYSSNWFATHVSDMHEAANFSLAPGGHADDLLVWPEAPAPFSYQDQNFAGFAERLAAQFGHPFLVGVIEWKPSPDPGTPGANHSLVPYNSAVLVDAKGRNVFTYDKIHLVPFGEYEPFPLIHRVVKSVSSEIGGFAKGIEVWRRETSLMVTRFPPFICYEAIYPGEIRQFAAEGAQLFINISNDGWFGRSAAAEQHLRMARVRAVENRRLMSARDQQRHHRVGRSVWPDFFARCRRMCARGRSALRLSDGS